jgi:hypothetical protein
MFQNFLSVVGHEILPIQADNLVIMSIFIQWHHSLHERHYDVINPALALSIKPVHLQHIVIPFTD